MMTVRKAAERGRFRNDWLDSHHSFSFGEYHDPAHMGVSLLRVLNDDRVIAGAGFPTHPHRDMEIVSYVLAGELAHSDSLGNGSVIRPGDVQLMSAGRGVTHSEFNPSATEGTHFLQIWLLPAETGIEPSYQQKHFDAADRRSAWQRLVSPDGVDGSLVVNSDANLFGALPRRETILPLPLEHGRRAYLHVARGRIELADLVLEAGDAVTLVDEGNADVMALEDAELLFFDLP